jgi:fibronectin type 3 domain-containing protein
MNLFAFEEKTIVYEVKENDTITEILKKHSLRPIYGPNGYLKEILKLNSLKSSNNLNLIYPKEKIILPNINQKKFVKKEETINKVTEETTDLEEFKGFSTSVTKKEPKILPRKFAENQIYILYEVKKNDMISMILERYQSVPIYGKDGNLMKTLDLNPDKKPTDGDLIYPDEKIILPIPKKNLDNILNSKDRISILVRKKEKFSPKNKISLKKFKENVEKSLAAGKSTKDALQELGVLSKTTDSADQEIPFKDSDTKEKQSLSFEKDLETQAKEKQPVHTYEKTPQAKEKQPVHTYEKTPQAKEKQPVHTDGKEAQKDHVTQVKKKEKIEPQQTNETMQTDDINFKAEFIKSAVVLTWILPKEYSTLNFEIKKSLNDQKNYKTIKKLSKYNTYQDEDVAPGNSYFYMISFLDQSGQILKSESTSLFVPFDEPVLKATLVKEGVQLSWNLGRSKGLFHIAVKRSKVSGTDYSILDKKASSNTFLDKLTKIDKKYYYVITLHDEKGNEITSNEVSVTPPPVFSKKLTAVLNGPHVVLSWETKALEDQQVSYEVKRTTVPGKQYSSIIKNLTTNTYEDINLIPETKYFYVVEASDEVGNTVSSQEVVILTPPPTPILTGVLSKNVVKLEWSIPNKIPGTTFELKRSQVKGKNYVTLLDGLKNQSYQDNNILHSNDYYYIVLSKTKNSKPTVSNEVTIKVPLGEPVLKAKVENKGVQLSWDKIVSNKKITIEIKKSLVSGSEHETIAKLNNKNNYTDDGVKRGNHYFYIMSLSDEEGSVVNSKEIAIMTPPIVPTGITAKVNEDRSVQLNWEENTGTSPVTYQIQRSTTSGKDFKVIAENIKELEYTDKKSEPGTQYFYRIVAQDQDRNQVESTEISVLTPPDGPQLTGVLKNNIVELNWTYTKSNSIVKFDVKRSEKPKEGHGSLIKNLTVTSYADKTIKLGYKYYYIIEIKDKKGNTAISNEIAITTPPTPPGKPKVTFENEGIALKWDESKGATAVTYEIKRSTVRGKDHVSVAKDVLINTYTEKGLAPETRYYYIIVAKDSEGNSSVSSEVSVLTPLAVPTLTASFSKEGALLEWSLVQPESSRVLFEVKKSPTSGKGYKTILDKTDAKSYRDKLITPGSIYYYVVVAKNKIGETKISPEVMVKAPYNQPELKAKFEKNAVILSWTKNSSNRKVEFEIKRSFNSGKDFTSIKKISNVNTYKDDSVKKGNKYFYIVTLIEEDKNSMDSNEVALVTPPVAPSQITTVLNAENKIQINWIAESGNADVTYKIYKSITGGRNFKLIAENLKTITYTDTEVLPGNKYFYKVTVVNENKEQSDSKEFSCTTIPVSPKNLTARLEGKVIKLSWEKTAGNGNVKYELKRSEKTNEKYYVIAQLTGTNFVDKLLLPEEEYFYVVTARSDGGASPHSNEVSLVSYNGQHLPSSLKTVLGARYLQLTESDMIRKLESIVHSSASASFHTDFIHHWKETLRTNIGLGVLSLNMMQPPTRVLNTSNFYLFNVNMGIEHNMNKNIYLKYEQLFAEDVVYQYQGYRNLNHSSVWMTHFKGTGGFTFITNHALKANAEGSLILSSPIGFDPNLFGYGFALSLGIHHQSPTVQLGSRLFYQMRTTKTTQVTSNIIEAGILGELTFDLGYQ